jgi:hypothetical protein
MIFRFRFDDALSGNDLRHARLIGFARHLHRFDQRFADMPNHLAPGSLRFRVEAEFFEQATNDLFMLLGLTKILLPFSFEFIVNRALMAFS